jgi:hypothetical protein
MLRIVIWAGIVVGASQETNFTKDADVATRAWVGCGRHFRVAVRIDRIRIVVLTSAPKKEDNKR